MIRFRPDSFEMNEGETNLLTIDLTAVKKSGTITGTPTVENSDLTFASTALDGTTLTSLVSGGVAGTNYVVTVSVVLGNGETKVGAIELEWKDPGYEYRTGTR